MYCESCLGELDDQRLATGADLCGNCDEPQIEVGSVSEARKIMAATHGELRRILEAAERRKAEHDAA